MAPQHHTTTGHSVLTGSLREPDREPDREPEREPESRSAMP